jgi:beta-glucosidase
MVPLHHLVGFERVSLKAGESRSVKFTLTAEMMSFYNEDGKLTLEPGTFRLEIGGCSPGKRGQNLGAPKPVTAVFEVK